MRSQKHFFLKLHCPKSTLTIVLATRRRWRTVPHRFAARHSLGAHRAALQMYHYVRIAYSIVSVLIGFMGLKKNCTLPPPPHTHYTLSDLYVVVHLKRRAVCAK